MQKNDSSWSWSWCRQLRSKHQDRSKQISEIHRNFIPSEHLGTIGNQSSTWRWENQSALLPETLQVWTGRFQLPKRRLAFANLEDHEKSTLLPWTNRRDLGHFACAAKVFQKPKGHTLQNLTKNALQRSKQQLLHGPREPCFSTSWSTNSKCQYNSSQKPARTTDPLLAPRFSPVNPTPTKGRWVKRHWLRRPNYGHWSAQATDFPWPRRVDSHGSIVEHQATGIQVGVWLIKVDHKWHVILWVWYYGL